MGGFLFNGCGAADTVSKLMFLKTDLCPNCRKEREFYLAKIRMKIHVVFIPTIPLNTKYGIVCSKCKTGLYISEDQMRQIMSADDTTKVLIYDAIMHPDASSKASQELPSHNESITEAIPQVKLPESTSNIDAPLICLNCGHALTGNESFCGACGHVVSKTSDRTESPQLEEMASVQIEEQVSTCPQCGKPVPHSAAFCGNCGIDLRTSTIPLENAIDDEEDVTSELSAPSVEETVIIQSNSEAELWTCSLCDTRNSRNLDRCQLCGQKRP